MASLLGMFLAKVLDPFLIVAALFAGAASQGWRWVFVWSAIPAIIVEVILSFSQTVPRSHLFPLGVGYIASLLWTSLAFKLVKWCRIRRSSKPGD